MMNATFIHYLGSSLSALMALACLGGTVYLGVATTSLQQQAAQLEGEATDANTKAEYYASVRALLRDTQEDRAQLLAIADGIDAVALVQLIEDTARRLRVAVSIDAVAPLSAHPKDGSLEGVLVTMQVRGSFTLVHTFVAAMQDFPVPTVVESLRTELTDGEWRSSVRVRFYLPKQMAEGDAGLEE